MLYVRAEVRPSPIHGLGVFAVEPIVRDTLVARWTRGVDYVLSPSEMDKLPKQLRAHLAEFTWHNADDSLLYGTVDAGRFINHARPPTLRWSAHSDGTVAARDIAPGEELTEDYSEFDADFASYAHEMTGALGPSLRERVRRGEAPAIFSCGCSHLKVGLGRCDLFDEDGKERPNGDG